MIDPVAVRSYLGSLGQQGGGGQGAGGVAAMLANLRQRLYGQQAGQQQGQIADYVRNLPGGAGQPPGANPAAGMPNGVPPRLQALAAQDPAAAQARFAQFQAGQLPGQQGQPQIQSFPMPPAGRPMRQGGAVDVRGSGGPSGSPGSGPFGPPPPGATWRPDPSTADTGGGMFVNAQGQPVDHQGRVVADVLAGRGGPGTDIGFQPSGPFLSEPLPYDAAVLNADQATLNGLTGFPGAGGGPGPQFQSGGGLMAPAQMPPTGRQRPAQGVAQGAGGPSSATPQPSGPSYGDDGVMAQMPGNRAKPTAPAGPAASPAVLGTQEFQGPNARRINAARQGIFNNVRQALRRPVAGGGK
jgi:hypothetical protein